MFKAARSTAVSSNESFRSIKMFSNPYEDNKEDNGVSDLVSNSDKVMVGTPFSMLRKKGGQQNNSFS